MSVEKPSPSALASVTVAARRMGADGSTADRHRAVPLEAPVAVSILGIGYAVMMATPADLEDFAYGFARAERLIARVRHRAAESSCGLCGIENLEQALRPLPALPRPGRIEAAAIFRALEAIRAHQPLNAETGAVHAAAHCDAAGNVVAAREDVGRHNAFDKLVGHCLRGGRDMGGGFALLTARGSYELVEKAALAGVPMLVTISAPTSLAVERAKESGLTFVALARADSLQVMNDPHGLFA